MLRRSIRFRLRVWLVLAPFYLAGLTILVLGGFVPNTLAVLEALVVFATLLLGRRWGFVVLAVTVCTTALSAARVMLCSAYAPEDVAPPLGMVDAFLTKPFTPDTLAGIVGDLVASAR